MDNVYIDSSFVKALLDPSDKFHDSSKKIMSSIEVEGSTLVFSNYVIDESFTLLRNKCGLQKALLFRDYLAQNSAHIRIVRVTLDDEAKAWPYFGKDWSRLSYTDCVSFACMKRLGIEVVASFASLS